MLDEKKLIQSLEGISDEELTRFRDFVRNHSIKQIEFEGKFIDYMICGQGSDVILTFAGCWGPPQLIYDISLGFEKKSRIVTVDISPFKDTESMCQGVDRVLEIEKIDKTVLLGQSFTGIIAQIYFRRRFKRIDGMVLINTIAPKAERCKKWALILIRWFPLSLFKPLIKKKLGKLSKIEKPVSEKTLERMRFKSALLINIMDQYFTSEVLKNAAFLAFAFNRENSRTSEAFIEWKGQVLIITSEDDPYYSDAEILSHTLPQAAIFKLPSGYGHIAPLIHKEEFHAKIQQFIDNL